MLYSRYQIRFGQHDLSMPLRSFGEEIKEVIEVTIHKKFNIPHGSRYYDIAVIKFTSLTFSQNIKPICMPQSTMNPFLRAAVSPGWGAEKKNGIAKDVLHQVQLTIFDTR